MEREETTSLILEESISAIPSPEFTSPEKKKVKLSEVSTCQTARKEKHPKSHPKNPH